MKSLPSKNSLEEELKSAMLVERDAVLKDIKDKIKRFEFKATDFKGLLKSRVTQGQVDDFLAKKAADAKKTATKKKRELNSYVIKN